MLNFLKLYLLTVPIFLVIDLFWLGLVAKNFYRNQLGELLTDNINWISAVTFYLLFIAGIIIFAVLPALKEHSLLDALFLGSLFGFFSYSTYDLTNLATTKNWPFLLSIVDIIWGTFLSGLVATLSFLITSWLNF